MNVSLEFGIEIHKNIEDIDIMISRKNTFEYLASDVYIFDIFENMEKNVLQE